MLVELSIIPAGNGSHLSGHIAEAVKIIDSSGLPFQLTPAGTCIEGEWDQIMGVMRRCHERVREMSPHVITSIRIEDDAGERNKLQSNVTSVEQKIGHPLHQMSAGHQIVEAKR